MDYMREINAFYDWLATNPVSDSARNLWHALMHTANRAGWIPEFAVAMSVLEAKTGLSRPAVYRARNILKEAGRITFKNRGGNLASMYMIVPFVSHIDTHAATRMLHMPQHDYNTYREHNTTYPTDTPYTKTKTKTKTNIGPAPGADALALNPSQDESVKEDGAKKPGDAALIRQTLEGFTQNAELRAALFDWIDMRKKMRKPLTARAMELALKGLAELSRDTRTQTEIVNEAITRSWLKFYPLTDKGGTRSADIRPDDKQPYELSGITRF